MATGFYVNLEHLGYFKQQVVRNLQYARRATDVIDLLDIRDELASSGGVAGVSAAGYIVPTIKEWLDRAAHDSESVCDALDTSANALHFSREYYAKVDHGQAAKLDRLFDTSNLGSLLTPGSRTTRFSFPGPEPIKLNDVKGWSSTDTPQDYTQKDYHWVDLYPIEKLGPKTEPSAVFGQNWILSVDQAAGNIGNAIPALTPVRWVFQALFGKDVVAEISELISGDWLAVEKVARAFHWHGQVQHDLHDNLMRGLFAMQGMWIGAAASQMQDTMQRLVKNGIKVHAQFFWEARDRILEFAKATYHTFKTAEEFVNLAISLLEPVTIAKKLEKSLDAISQGVLGALKGKWDEVAGAVGELNHAGHVAGAIIAYPSALSGSPANGGIPNGFSHPADTNRDGRAGASELKGN
jgi:hypothetical protein